MKSLRGDYDGNHLQQSRFQPFPKTKMTFSQGNQSARLELFKHGLEVETSKMSGNIERESRSAYPAEKASQGEIILKQPWQRAVFIGGLAAAVLLPIVILFFTRR